jgi:VanZ family protein
VEPIEGVMDGRASRRAFSLAKLATILLAAYWLLLMIGTHVPASAGGSPVIWDKLVHWAAYAGLAVLLALVVQSRYGLSLRRYTVICLIAIGYGAIDELAQLPIPGRNADFHDWVADLLGVASGLILFRILSTLISLRCPRSIRPRVRPSALRDRFA